MAELTAGKRILEDLLEAEKLKDGEVDSGMEAETTLVGAESGVELHTVPLVDLALALVVFPDHAELDDALWNRADLEGLLVLGILLEQAGGLQGGDEFWVSVSNPSVAQRREGGTNAQDGVTKEGHVPLRACSNSGSAIVLVMCDGVDSLGGFQRQSVDGRVWRWE